MPIDLHQIDMGKNDAKLDSLERYFYDCGYVNQIKKMDKFFIIGRKGAGKSAIAYYIKKNVTAKTYTNIVSFRDIPIQLMDQFYDNRFTASNKLTSLWTFILAIELAKLLLDYIHLDVAASKKIRTFLELINPSLKDTPKDYLAKVKKLGWKIGCDYAEINGSTQCESEETNVIDYTNALIDILIQYSPVDCNFHLFFDELDDSYQDSDDYKNMIIALFKASMDLNSKFRSAEKRMSAILLLRDDIYDKLVYSDKNKWRDFGIFLDWTPINALEWDEQKLFKLANERIGASIEETPDQTKNYWNQIFSEERISRDDNAFDFIIARTFFRPRDIIQYVKSSIETAINLNKTIIDKKVILATDAAFGTWFKDELIDELAPVIPNIRQIFDVLKTNQKSIFTLTEIEPVFIRHKLTEQYNTQEILQILYDYSIVGQFENENTHVPTFRYRNKDINFNPSNKFCLHYGLRSALGFYVKDAPNPVKPISKKDIKKNLPKGFLFKRRF